MLCRTIISASLLAMMSVASADAMLNMDSTRVAIQGALVTEGDLSIGAVLYAPTVEIGITVSASLNNARYETKTFTPVIFAGLRKSILEHTYFTYGVDFADTIGRQNGLTINSEYQIGPYISLEQMLTSHLMLSGWINPYQYGYQKIGGVSTSTNGIFSAGGIALNYLF